VCSSCQKPEYPADWTTSVYVSSTLTVTITKPAHPETNVPAYPTGTAVAEHPAPKPSNVYGEDKQKTPESEVPEVPEVPSHEVPSHEVPSYEVPSHEAPKASSTSTMTVTLTQTPSPYAYTPQAHIPVAAPHASYPAGNGTEHVVPSSTGAPAKPTSTGYPVIPGMQTPPEFEGAAGRVSVGLGMVVGVAAMLVL
jgi:chitinase